jgi:outer membrane protein OmpA-like peptidoglycan-associated protein
MQDNQPQFPCAYSVTCIHLYQLPKPVAHPVMRANSSKPNRWVRLSLLSIWIMVLCASCVQRPFVPVSTGREYGNPKTPMMVSHLPEANQWALSRTGHHNVFQKVLCFNYPCRKMIGRRKTLKAISMEALKKRIRKNAKRGVYKKYNQSPKSSPDSLPKLEEPVVISVIEMGPVISAPILKADSLITLSEVLFEINSYKLNAAHFASLDSLGRFLAAHPTLEVNISGHTDNTGRERHNIALSTRRVEVVAEYLIDKGAVFDKISFKGFGSARPIASNDTEVGRSKNRRVEILIKNPD